MEEEKPCSVRNEENLLVEKDESARVIQDENGELPTETTENKLEEVKNNIKKTNLGTKEVKKDRKPTEKSDLSTTESRVKLNLCKTEDDTNFVKSIDLKPVISETKKETRKESASDENLINDNSDNNKLVVKLKNVCCSDDIEEMLMCEETRNQGLKDEELPLLVLKKVTNVSTPDNFSRKKIGKRKNMWTSNILQKKAKKGDWSCKMDETEKKNYNEEFELSNYMEHDKNYFFALSAKIGCKLCSFKGKFIVQHYKMAHPEREVLISRLNPDIAEILIEDAIRNREEYDKDHPKVEKMIYNYKCPFCLMLIKDTTNIYYNHISTHTGEFCFHCNHCSYWSYNHTDIRSHLNIIHCKIQKTEYKMVYLNPKISKYVFAYICSECNFIQLIRTSVEEHVMVYHPGNQEIHRVNMGLFLHDDVVHSNLNGIKLEEVKVKIEPKELEDDPHPIELATFINQPDLHIKDDSERDRTETPISDQLQIKLVTEMEEMKKLNKEVEPPEQPERATESVKVIEIGPISVVKEFNISTFHCKVQNCNYSSEDKKAFAIHCEIIHKDFFYNFGTQECNICSIKFEYKGKFATVYDIYLHIVTMHKDFFLSPITEDKNEAMNSKVKLPMIACVQSLGPNTKLFVSTDEDNSNCTSVVTDILMTDSEKQNRKCPKAVAVMMKPPLLSAFYKCPQYDCSFASTLSLPFQKHFATHSILMDTLVPCLYCDYKVSCSSYVIHLEVRHGHCLYGCGDCFYRTTNSYFITMHWELMHPNTEFNILQLDVVTSNRISADTTSPNLSELVLPYNCKDDGFLSCLFKTLYFEEYLKHVEAIHQADGLGSFSSEHEPHKEAVMEGWLAKEVGPFQCRYCRKATVTHQEMGRHQAEFHAHEQCLFYYRKFVPNDTVIIPEQVNLEDPSFINHVIHLPNQVHLCNFKLTDGLVSSTCAKLTNWEHKASLPLLPMPTKDIKSELDQSSVSLDDPEVFNMLVKDEAYMLDESDSLCLDEQPKDDDAHNDASVTACKLQCKWKDCYQTYHFQAAFEKHIKKNHVQLQSGKEFTCLWKNCPRKLKPYTSKYTLLYHMSSHTGEKPYKCLFQGCNKAFAREMTLKIHQRSHTGKKPYLCGFSNCFESFSLRFARDSHQRVHYEPEAYTCQVTGCSRKYANRSSFRVHMKKHMADKHLEAKTKSVEKKWKENDVVLNSLDGVKYKKTHYDTLQCQWEGCYQQNDSQAALIRHIEKTHLKFRRGEEVACFWMDCPRKSKPFCTKQYLRIHMRVHSREKPYECTFQGCNKAFRQSGYLNIHQRFHTGEKPYKCSVRGCSKAFSVLESLKVHLRSHRREKPYRCQFSNCLKSFASNASRISHQRKVHDTITYACQVAGCSEKNTDLDSLQKHMENHMVNEQLKVRTVEDKQKEDDFMLKKSSNSSDQITRYEILQCEWEGCYLTYDSQMGLVKHIAENHVQLQRGEEFTCFWINCPRRSKPFTSKEGLKLHMRVHSREKPYKCSFQDCDKAFSRSDSLNIHQRHHTGERPYLCQFSNCFKSFTCHASRIRHQKMNHNTIPCASQVNSCSEKYTNPDSLQKHVTDHTVDEQLKIKSVENNQKKSDFVLKKSSNSTNGARHQTTHYDTLQCEWERCYRIYDSQTALVKHIREDHVQLQRGEEFTCFWINCPRRSKPFTSKESLRMHMRVHSGEKPYKCPFQGCDKAFSRFGGLNVHRRHHTGEKPYTCQFCFKRFSCNAKRIIHQRGHRDTISYASQVSDCSEKYSDPDSLQKHVTDHMADEQLKIKSVENNQKDIDFVLKKSSNSSDGAKHQMTLYNTFQCKWKGCYQNCDSQSALVKHIENHVELRKGKFTCLWINCPRKSKPYSKKRRLLIHMRVHSGESGPYRCSFQGCNKAYSESHNLKIHQRRHTGKNTPYMCQLPYCFESFSTIYDREYHQRKHYDTETYACQVTGCSKQYANPSGLQKHMENHIVNEELEVKQKLIENEQNENDLIIYHL